MAASALIKPHQETLILKIHLAQEIKCFVCVGLEMKRPAAPLKEVICFGEKDILSFNLDYSQLCKLSRLISIIWRWQRVSPEPLSNC